MQSDGVGVAGKEALERERGRMRESVRGGRLRAGRGLVAGRWAAMLCVLLLTLLVPVGGHGQGNDRDDDHDEASSGHPEDRAGIFSTIVVSRDQPAADVACMFCTVRVEGDVRGDVAVMFGTVSVAEGETISGDVAMLFSTLNVAEGARVNGDLATLFSTAQIAPGAHIRGDRAMVASGLGMAVLLGPILLLIGIVWLVVWGLRRALVY